MALLEWNESLRVNVANVDEQHQQLVQMINTLHDAMADGRSKEIMGELMGGLIRYTVIHFGTEEAYFDQFGYPQAEDHKEQHRRFVAQVGDFKQGFDDGRLFLSMDVMDFLSEWLVEHIQGSDRAFGPFLNQHGVV
ncbi:MAG: bacteriohemerythrin [Coriobacteriia bacterium]